MSNSYRKKLKIAAFVALLGVAPDAFAQAVIFPQEEQAGVASAQYNEADQTYTISNNLLSATFKKVDNKLTFESYNPLTLKPSDNLFKVLINDGEEVLSSQMKLVSVETQALEVKNKAAKASLHYSGQAIVAKYTYTKGDTHDLSITWRAILRDGSHYLRTEMEIVANKNSDMYAIVPLAYEVDNPLVNGIHTDAPSVVGNTRGAVIMNSKFFAGLETPTSYNTVGGVNTSDMNSFNPKSWTAGAFNWAPGNQTPAEILTDSQGLQENQVKAARGVVLFQEAGDLNVTFNYQSGGEALNIVGVDVMNKNGHIVSHDYHVGKAGKPSSENVFHLHIPESEAYVLRYFMETKSGALNNSNGEIELSLKVRDLRPRYKVVFDGPIGAAPQTMLFANFGRSTRAAATAIEIGDQTVTHEKVAGDWGQMQSIPLVLRQKGYPAGNIKSIEQPVKITADGRLAVDFQWRTSGSRGINFIGVDLVDANGKVVSADYHHAFAGGNGQKQYYHLIAKAGDYTLRYMAENKTEPIDSKANVNINLTKGSITVAGNTTDHWTTNSWTAMGNIPQAVSKMGFPNNKVKSYEKVMNYTGGPSEMAVTLKYNYQGGHALHLVGVDVLDAQGKVVGSDYHIGSTGGSHSKNTYYVILPGDGVYTLRYIAEDKSETILSNGDIQLVPTAVPALTTQDSWTKEAWKPMKDIPADVINKLGYQANQVKSIEKTVKATEAASRVTATFTFTRGSGSTKMNLAGVDLLDAEGNVVASDYHIGSSGDSHNKNSYEFIVPKTGVYRLRYIAVGDNGIEPITSSGTITYASSPMDCIGQKPQHKDIWRNGDWKAMGEQAPKGATDLGFTGTEVAAKSKQIYVQEAGGVNVTFEYQGGYGGRQLHPVGVDLVDENGKVVASDYHKGHTGNKHVNNVFRMIVHEPGLYTIRYMAESKTEGFDSGGNLTLDFVTDTFYKVFADDFEYGEWQPSSWLPLEEKDVALRVREVTGKDAQIKYMVSDAILMEGKGKDYEVEDIYEVLFESVSGQKLNLAGVELLNEDGQVVCSDYHKGSTGLGKNENSNNVYRLKEPNSGTYRLRYIAFVAPNQQINSTGYIRGEYQITHTFHFPTPEVSPIEGRWSRNIVLKANDTLNVSSVIGLVAKDQPRRSVASYVERERAVPWRPYPIYNSWYELNINRNNDPNYTKNMNEEQCLAILNQWKEKFFDVHKTGIKAFVWDDGWDVYGLWSFNKNFQPHGFSRMDAKAQEMNAGTGCWLGPVGGYGDSGNFRRSYWNGKDADGSPRGGMQLSNPKYYNVFYNACDSLLTKRGYDFRYFKFDGISGQFSAVGPDSGDKGNENAEGIINAELTMRKIKDDIFFNTSVGTWASPFWFGITDAVWRQENDYGEAGNHGNSRERWITYRDRLVYQNFVQNSPMCPINNLMTHGFILTSHGGSGDRTYEAIVREMRCAFACGSAMVELYNDYELMNSINGGKLWGELAKCIQWQEANADALPDAHWVGGNPWDGAAHHIYGWAGWNGKNAVFTLRNGDEKPQKIKFTLREALEIPKFVSGTITFNKGFEDQQELTGFVAGQPINIDTPFELTLPGSSVYIFDNTQDVKNINAAKDALKAAIAEGESLQPLVGLGTGKYTCDGLDKTLAAAKITYDNLYAAQQEIDAATKSLKAVLDAAQLNAPETGKFYRIKASSNSVVEQGSQLYLSSVLSGDKMTVAATAADNNTLFYLSADNRLTAIGAMQNVAGTGLATTMGEAVEFAAHKGQLGRYTIGVTATDVLSAAGTAVGAVPATGNDKAAAWELVAAEKQDYTYPVKIGAALYSTLDVPVSLVIPTSVKAYRGQINEQQEVMKLVPVENIIPAGTPVVLKGEASTYQFALAPQASVVTENSLSGTFVQMLKPTGKKVYTLQRPQNKPIGFYLYGGANMAAHKAYLELPLNSKVSRFIFDDGDLTGIEELEIEENMEVFDLSGRRVLHPEKGLYIVNGQKVYIK